MKAKLIIDGKEIEIEISEEEATVLMGKNLKKTGYERAERGEKYYRADYLGVVKKESDNRLYYDEDCYNTANYYSDETVAKNNARADKLYRQLRRFAVEHREKELDWKDKNQAKFIIGFGKDKGFAVATAFLRGFGGIYFDSEETCQLAIDTFYDELKWYFSEYQDSL